VIATTLVKVLSITKEDFIEKMPNDIKQFFEESADQKYRWIEKRFIDILKNLNSLKDNYFEEITEKSRDI
jgi:hypothetical protein